MLKLAAPAALHLPLPCCSSFPLVLFSLLAPLLLTGMCWDRVFDIFVDVFLLTTQLCFIFPPSLVAC